jgi:hypothetical protein
VVRPNVTRRSVPLLLTVALPSKSETLHRLRQVFRWVGHTGGPTDPLLHGISLQLGVCCRLIQSRCSIVEVGHAYLLALCVHRLQVASAQPLHFLVAAEVLEAAVGGHAEHLAGLLFPSGLEPSTDENPAPGAGEAAAGKPLALPAPAGGSTGTTGATGAGSKTTGSKLAPHSALDGLLGILSAGTAVPPGVSALVAERGVM